jgi:hypothetical protein
MAIAGDNGRITSRQGAANGGIHTIIRCTTGNYQLGDGMLAQYGLKRRIQKSIARLFAYDDIGRFNAKVRQQFPASRIGMMRITFRTIVLNKYNDARRLPHPARKIIQPSYKHVRAMPWACVRKRALLHIDDEKR